MPRFVALDWGTSSFRAYLVARSGAVLETISTAAGILSVKDQAFDATLEQHIAAWEVSLPVVASGMITSRQGWLELDYAACPAGLAAIAAAGRRHTTQRGRQVFFISGVSARAADGSPDVMRGEETQVQGASVGGREYFIAPGTHSKWITVEDGTITGFTTYMTGEVFALLRHNSILSRLIADEVSSSQAFARGVAAALADPAGFLHRIFTARTLPLFNEMPPADIASYLSGQVIGTEIAHATAHHEAGAHYTILATPALAAHYGQALALAGLSAGFSASDVVIRGQQKIAAQAGVI
jgi:2-dehydro-3-deoxygalactonokinase